MKYDFFEVIYISILFEILIQVKYWITFNEPKEIVTLGYGCGMMAPGIKSPFEGVYLAAHNLLKAHASAWHLYDDSYRKSQDGK